MDFLLFNSIRSSLSSNEIYPFHFKGLTCILSPTFSISIHWLCERILTSTEGIDSFRVRSAGRMRKKRAQLKRKRVGGHRHRSRRRRRHRLRDRDRETQTSWAWDGSKELFVSDSLIFFSLFFYSPKKQKKISLSLSLSSYFFSFFFSIYIYICIFVMDLLSGTDASGRQISLLNINKQRANSYGSNPSSVDGDSPSPGGGGTTGQTMSSASPYSSDNDINGHQLTAQQPQGNTKRKYHCRELGCDKSFTTR